MNVGFIGAGNMGGALARAISQNKEINVYIFDLNEEKATSLAKSIGAKSTDMNFIAKSCDFVFLGVKPNVITSVAESFGRIAKTSAAVISMAAGVTTEVIQKALGENFALIRIMPNTPVAVGEGLTAYATGSFVTDSVCADFEYVMKTTGTLVRLEESEIDSFCAIAGCGPAYAYMFIDALADGAEKCGIPREAAISYAAQMLRGSARMALEGDTDPKTLCKNVCSPGGATIEGVKVLESAGFSESVCSAIEAAFKRTKELGK